MGTLETNVQICGVWVDVEGPERKEFVEQCSGELGNLIKAKFAVEC